MISSVINGYAIEIMNDGRIYKGEYKNNIKHGQGSEISLNGEKSEGEWKDGKLINGIIS